MAIIGAAFPIAILVGPVLGGAITDYWGWQWVFWINIPVGAAALGFALIAVPDLEPGTTSGHFDAAGAAVFTASLVALVLAVTWAVERSAILAAAVALTVSIVGFVAFILIERRAAEPIVPLGLFANRTIMAGTALSMIVGVGLFSLTAYLPTYVQMAYQTSATVSGLVPIATVFGILVSNLLTGWLASRSGSYRIFPILGTILGAAGLFVMAALPAGLPLWVPMIVMGLVGMGTGAFMTLIIAVVQGAAPASQTGTITATVNLVRQVGSTVATAVMGAVIGFGVATLMPVGLDASTLTPQLVHEAAPAVQASVAQIYSSVFTPIFVALAGTYALGIVAAVLLPQGRLSDDPVPTPHTASESLSA